MTKTLTAICTTAGLVCALGVPVSAATFDRSICFTFSRPVAVPGATLPAGRYLFRLVDPNTGARVMQVLNSSGTESYALFQTLPAHRSEPSVEPGVSFMETAGDMPPAIETLWHEGEENGYEFLYPQDQLYRLTQGVAIDASPLASGIARTGEPGVKAPGYTHSAAAAVPGNRPVDDLASAGIPESPASVRSAREGPALSNGGQSSDQSQRLDRSQPSLVSSPAEREALPRTASPIPLALILGLGAIGCGAWLRRKTA